MNLDAEVTVRLLVVIAFCALAAISIREAVNALRSGRAYLYVAGWRWTSVRREDDAVGYSTVVGANVGMAALQLWFAALIALKVI